VKIARPLPSDRRYVADQRIGTLQLRRSPGRPRAWARASASPTVDQDGQAAAHQVPRHSAHLRDAAPARRQSRARRRATPRTRRRADDVEHVRACAAGRAAGRGEPVRGAVVRGALMSAVSKPLANWRSSCEKRPFLQGVLVLGWMTGVGRPRPTRSSAVPPRPVSSEMSRVFASASPCSSRLILDSP
jgi:hypothetical protein